MTDENLRPEEVAEAAPPVPQETAEPATASDAPPEEEVHEDAQPEEKPKPRGGFQRRIDELTRNWREAERRVDQLMELVQGKAQAPQQEETKPPTLEQFGYDEGKYQAALLKYAETVADQRINSRFSEWEQRQQQQAKASTFKQREAEFAGTVEDYADKVYDPTVPISQPMADVIADSEIGPQLAYHLADNRDVAARIAALPPILAARELGRIEARLLASKTAPKPVSKAPPPPPKIAGVEAEVDKDPDSMSMSQWLKWREKQPQRKGR